MLYNQVEINAKHILLISDFYLILQAIDFLFSFILPYYKNTYVNTSAFFLINLFILYYFVTLCSVHFYMYIRIRVAKALKFTNISFEFFIVDKK